MPNLVEVTYKQTGKSKKTNALGMRAKCRKGLLLSIQHNTY